MLEINYLLYFNFYLVNMYNMQIKFLGIKWRVQCIVVSMIIGVIIGYHLLRGCSCCEGMSSMDYAMNNGVHSDTYENKFKLVKNMHNFFFSYVWPQCFSKKKFSIA